MTIYTTIVGSSVTGKDVRRRQISNSTSRSSSKQQTE
jgi:hypothetical protein